MNSQNIKPKKTTGISLDPDLMSAVKADCKTKGISFSWVVEQALTEWAEKKGLSPLAETA